MTGLLRPHLPFDPMETVASYAGRLSALHTGLGVHRLAGDLRINTEHLMMGNPAAVDAFAKATGADIAALQRVNLQAFGSDVLFRGERCQKKFLARAADKYCPACLTEGGSPKGWRQQVIWSFAPVHRCARHNLVLSRLPTPARTLQEGLTGAEFGTQIEADGTVPTYLTWLENRLSDVSDSEEPWLANQGIQQVLEASMMMGIVIEHGHKAAAKTLAPQEVERATETGFAFYTKGPCGAVQALDLIRSASSAQAVQAGPLARYGNLFDWLDRRCNGREPGPIRDLLRDHIIEHDAIDVGETVLGVELKSRRFHSVQSLADQLGINRSRMSRLLQKLGRIPAGATDAESGLLRFDAQEISTLVADFETAIPLDEVADYIGATLFQMQALYAENVIRPLVPRNKRGAVRRVVFSRSHLDAFLARIEKLPVHPSQGSADLHPVSYVCQRGLGTTADLIKAITQGRVPAYRAPGKQGLSSILLDPKEVIAAKAL